MADGFVPPCPEQDCGVYHGHPSVLQLRDPTLRQPKDLRPNYRLQLGLIVYGWIDSSLFDFIMALYGPKFIKKW